MAAQIEAVLYVPVADNDAAAFDAAAWGALYRRFGEVAAGATRLGPHEGTWTSPDGQTFVEPVFTFEVALSSWFELPAFLDVVKWAQGQFRQRGIHFKVAGIHETYPP